MTVSGLHTLLVYLELINTSLFLPLPSHPFVCFLSDTLMSPSHPSAAYVSHVVDDSMSAFVQGVLLWGLVLHVVSLSKHYFVMSTYNDRIRQ